MNILTVLTAIYIVVSLSPDKCTYCKSLWIQASAKCPQCKCNAVPFNVFCLCHPRGPTSSATSGPSRTAGLPACVGTSSWSGPPWSRRGCRYDSMPPWGASLLICVSSHNACREMRWIGILSMDLNPLISKVEDLQHVLQCTYTYSVSCIKGAVDDTSVR